MSPISVPPRTARLHSIVLGLLTALLSLLLLGLIAGGVYFLGRVQALTPTYSVSVAFADAGGVDAGTPVRLAGVPVGTVERATVRGGQAVLDLRIRQEDKIPAGSRFVITPALFSMPAVVKIMPPVSAKAADTPLTGGTLEDPLASFAHADTMIDQWAEVGQKSSLMLEATTRTTRHLNALMSDEQTQGRLRQTLADAQTASRNSAQVTAQVSALLRRTSPPAQVLVTNLSQASAQISTMTRTGRPQVSAILANTARATGSAAQAAAQGRRLMTPSAAESRQLAQTLTDLSATVANLKDLTGKMSAVAGNVQGVSGDPQVAGDFKELLRHMQSTSARADALAANAQTLSGDPQVLADLKTTLHNLSALTQATQQLVTQLSKAAGKNQ